MMRNQKESIFEAASSPQFGPAYALAYSRDRLGVPQESGQVCFRWDAVGLYVFAELEDSCIVAKNRKDEQLHYMHGDVFELFLKPKDEDYYWEMYAVPSGNKSTLFFPSDRSELELNDFLQGHRFRGLEVAIEDSAVGWNARMFVPADQLTALGAGWGDGTEWTVLCGRYNYSSTDLADPELSMAPALSSTNYHLTAEYARLKFCG